ncbi:hypothetical protein PG990_011672 [Apiospora arundinis]
MLEIWLKVCREDKVFVLGSVMEAIDLQEEKGTASVFARGPKLIKILPGLRNVQPAALDQLRDFVPYEIVEHFPDYRQEALDNISFHAKCDYQVPMAVGFDAISDQRVLTIKQAWTQVVSPVRDQTRIPWPSAA